MEIRQILLKAIKDTIKSCPCCGGDDVYYKIINEESKQDVTRYDELNETDLLETVGCFTCGLNMSRKTGCNIISQWNKRVPLK